MKLRAVAGTVTDAVAGTVTGAVAVKLTKAQTLTLTASRLNSIKDDINQEKEAAEARAARVLSRPLPSNGDGLSEAAAAQSLSRQQMQAETEADDSPVKNRTPIGRNQNWLEDSESENDEDA